MRIARSSRMNRVQVKRQMGGNRRKVVYQQWSLYTGGNKRQAKMQDAKAATTLADLSDALRDLREKAPLEHESLLRDEPMAGRDCPLSKIIDAWFDPETLEPLPQTCADEPCR